MSSALRPNQIRPLTGSIPTACPVRSETSCWRWYSAQISRALAVSTTVEFGILKLHLPMLESLLPCYYSVTDLGNLRNVVASLNCLSNERSIWRTRKAEWANHCHPGTNE